MVLLIKEDVNGIFFSADVVLGLIPVLILILTVANTNIDYTDLFLEKSYFQKAQDTARNNGYVHRTRWSSPPRKSI